MASPPDPLRSGPAQGAQQDQCEDRRQIAAEAGHRPEAATARRVQHRHHVDRPLPREGVSKWPTLRRGISTRGSRFGALTCLPNTRARNAARRAIRKTKPRATGSGWPRSWRPARFGQQSSADGKQSRAKDAHDEESEFRSVGDELQTDETFDHDIINWGRSSTTPCLFRRSPQPGKRARSTRPSGTQFARDGSRPAHERGR
jgi:hypothetical protein